MGALEDLKFKSCVSKTATKIPSHCRGDLICRKHVEKILYDYKREVEGGILDSGLEHESVEAVVDSGRAVMVIEMDCAHSKSVGVGHMAWVDALKKDETAICPECNKKRNVIKVCVYQRGRTPELLEGEGS